MDAVIKVKITEFNSSLVERIKTLFEGKEDVELTISIDDGKQRYFESLAVSKKELELGIDLITFNSVDELEAYSNSKRA